MAKINDIHWQSASATNVGKVRRLNEDASLALPDTGIWVVADGMGGHHAGDYASRAVVDGLQNLPASQSLKQRIDEVSRTLQSINERLYQEGLSREARIIGTTVVVYLSVGREAAVVWAGDSRAYRWRDGQLEQLTRDHSRIQTLIEQGQLDANKAESHPDANVITRAVGVTAELQLDSRRLDVRDGDTIMLCSDGLYRYVSEQELTEVLGRGDASHACEVLVNSAMADAARDNITVVVTRAELDDTAIRTQINPTAAAATIAPPATDPTVLDENTPKS